MVKRWRRTQLEERMAYDGEWQDTGLIFTRKNGTLSDPDVISQNFDKIVAQLELKPVRLHDLRHRPPCCYSPACHLTWCRCASATVAWPSPSSSTPTCFRSSRPKRPSGRQERIYGPLRRSRRKQADPE